MGLQRESANTYTPTSTGSPLIAIKKQPPQLSASLGNDNIAYSINQHQTTSLLNNSSFLRELSIRNAALVASKRDLSTISIPQVTQSDENIQDDPDAQDDETNQFVIEI